MSVISIRKFILKGTFTEKGSLVAVKIQLELEIDGFKYIHEFCVLEKLIFQVVVGADFLKKYSAEIKFIDDKMRLKLINNYINQRVINAIDVKEADNRLQKII